VSDVKKFLLTALMAVFMGAVLFSSVGCGDKDKDKDKKKS